MASPAPNGTATNVVVGFANLYIAPANTTAPTLATTGVGTTVATPWVPAGFTETGVTINMDRKTSSIMVEELSSPVGVYADTSDLTIDISFAEDTVANIANAYGGGAISVVTPTTGVAGSTTLTLADALETLALLVVARNTFDLDRLIYIPEMVSAGKVKTQYQRAKAARSYPATFTAICPLSAITVTDATAAAS